MRDVCLVSDGAWPRRTGGVAGWTQNVLLALEGADVAVLTLGAPRSTAGEYDPPRAARTAELVARLRSVPPATRYLASGLDAAEQLLALRPDLVGRVVYVEHGDAVREALHGAAASEGGGAVPSGAAPAVARAIAARRRAVVRAAGAVVGVTTRTVRRGHSEGARRVACVANAVRPPTARDEPARSGERRLAYVGRFCRIKGIDRFVELARAQDRGGLAIGMAAGPFDEPRDAGAVEWLSPRGDPWTDRIGVLAMPSRLEASPLAALEAEARGIPALVSTAADLPASPLISRLPWCAACWTARLDALLRGGRARATGAALAAARWKGFVAAWRGVASSDDAIGSLKHAGASAGARAAGHGKVAP